MTRVDELPVAHEGAEGERLSTTQPFSTGMPQLGVEPLTEKSMWGVTPFDQLMCRIDFKESTGLGCIRRRQRSRISNGRACWAA